MNSKNDMHIAALIGFIIEGHPKSAIKEWADAEGVLDFETAWSAALDAMQDQAREFTNNVLPWAFLGLQECHRRLMDVGDYEAASKVLEKIIKLSQER